MEKPAINAILFGAMLFVLGMVPGLLGALKEGLENFRNRVFPPGWPVHRLETNFCITGDIWLLVGGGVMMIAGLMALLGP
jgi:hypothetical protein